MKKLQEIKSRKKEDVNKEGDDSKEENKEELSDSDNENEEELAKNLIKKLLEESKLEEAAAKDGINVESSSGSKNFVKQQNIDRVPSDKMIDDDELPFCCICTEDATIRCHGCDLDLYCSKCWKESHIDFQMEDHETSKYKAPKDTT